MPHYRSLEKGGDPQVKILTRDTTPWLEELLQDTRDALRSMRAHVAEYQQGQPDPIQHRLMDSYVVDIHDLSEELRARGQVITR